jgi:hypothetical protein
VKVSAVDWPSLIGALSRVERDGSDTSGLLSFGSEPQGGIFVESGKICWVAARGLQRRLRDLLSDQASLSRPELEQIYERCRARGQLLGETLVAEGLLRPDELERALRRHSAECLLDLCSQPLVTSWASHAGRGYAPRFTFRAVDLVFDSVTLRYPTERYRAEQELDAQLALGCRGVAFVADPSLDSLLPLAASDSRSFNALVALGRALDTVVRANRELGHAPRFAFVTSESGETLFLRWQDRLLLAVSGDDRAALASSVSLHLRKA